MQNLPTGLIQNRTSDRDFVLLFGQNVSFSLLVAGSTRQEAALERLATLEADKIDTSCVVMATLQRAQGQQVFGAPRLP